MVLGVVVFGLYLAGSGTVGTIKGHAPRPGQAHSTSLSGTLNCSQLEQLWKDAGGNPSAAFLAAEVAKAESGGRQYARDPLTGYYKDGNVDIGYWQVNTVHGNIPYDPIGNAEAAIRVSNNGSNWTPWVTYNKGLEVGQC